MTRAVDIEGRGVRVNGRSVGVGVGSAIPDSGVSRWKFEQDVTDSWDGNGGADDTGAGYTTDSAVGDYAKSFNDSGDVTVSDDASIDGKLFSIAFWYRTTDTTRQNFILKYDGSGYFIDLADQSGNGDQDMYFFVRGGGSSDAIHHENANLTDGVYRQIVVTKGSGSGASDLDMYINGSSVSTTDTKDQGAGDISTSANLHFGGPDNNFDGEIDDIRYYDKELTSTEVSNLYDTGSI